MGQFSNPVATHPRTNEVEVPSGPQKLILAFDLGYNNTVWFIVPIVL